MNNKEQMIKKLKKDFKVIREIGNGGMSTIYKVKKLKDKSNTYYALKCINEPRNVSFNSMFKNEIRLTRMFDDKRIIKYEGSVIRDDLKYMVMEYVDGRTLKDYILYSVDSMSNNNVLKKALDLAKGLREIHKKGVIHRDLKDTNIMITKDDRIKIIDLGISQDDKPLRLTKENHLRGSAHYIAPELLTNDRSVSADEQTDIFAYGILLYQMITLKLPFKGKNIGEIIRQIKRKEIPSVKHLNSKISNGLANVVYLSTIRDRNKRFKNMDEVIEYLEKIKKSKTSESLIQLSSVQESSSEKVELKKKKH